MPTKRINSFVIASQRLFLFAVFCLYSWAAFYEFLRTQPENVERDVKTLEELGPSRSYWDAEL